MKIAEVNERYDISSDTLRYYERIGLVSPVNRSEMASEITTKLMSGGLNSSSACGAQGCLLKR
jgi:hypothetical protein